MCFVLLREDWGLIFKLKKFKLGLDFDSFDFDDDWEELDYEKIILFDRFGKRFFICLWFDIVEFFEINYIEVYEVLIVVVLLVIDLGELYCFGF